MIRNSWSAFQLVLAGDDCASIMRTNAKLNTGSDIEAYQDTHSSNGPDTGNELPLDTVSGGALSNCNLNIILLDW